MKWLTIAVLATGCVSQSRVGPYVKQIVRQGDFLILHKCVIELSADELTETNCTVEQLPLRSIPQMMPPTQPPTRRARVRG